MTIAILLAILVPILSGLAIGFRAKTAEQAGTLAVASTLLNALLIAAVVLGADHFLLLFSLTDNLPIAFRVDDLARLFCALVAVVFPLLAIYAREYLHHESHQARFWMFFLITQGLLIALALAANLLTLYLFFEVMTLCTLPLVMHAGDENAIAAGLKYLYYSFFGASLALLALIVFASQGLPLNFIAGGHAAGSNASASPHFLVVSLLPIVGFGAKAGLFPLHSWLPTAHPIAPTPASALLSGLITKAGVLAIVRYVFFFLGADSLRQSWVQLVWMALALVSILVGSLMAYRETQLKTRLAYSTVSQLGYIMFGLATLHPLGVLGALFHMAVHGLAKNALFMNGGSIILLGGQSDIRHLNGLGRKSVGLFSLFALLAVVMVGIPPTGGFLSKWQIALGALGADIGAFGWLGPACMLLSALLAAGYLLPIPIAAFFTSGDEETSVGASGTPNLATLLPIGLLTLAAFLIGMFPDGLLGFIEGLVRNML